MKNQKGFSSVAIILILALAQIIGGSCWYLFKDRQAAEKKLDNVNTVSESGAGQEGNQKTQSSVADETANWKSYVSAKGRFSLRYPRKWAVGSRERDESCPEIFMAAPKAESLGRCATEYFGLGQIAVISEEGERLLDMRLSAGDYPYQKITSRKVMINGAEGLRESGTAKGQWAEKFVLPGLPDGAKIVVYSFYVNGRAYVAQYIQGSGDPNILREFDLMVTQTLKFNNDDRR